VAHGGSNPGAALGAIATGVGFLGAGVILRRGTTVRGLSTAATFWAVAAVGTAAGLQEYGMALGLTAAVLCAHVLLRPASAWIEKKAPPEENGPR
jgi:putative Mg2+ transporter-C (MgtC) family protein